MCALVCGTGQAAEVQETRAVCFTSGLSSNVAAVPVRGPGVSARFPARHSGWQQSAGCLPETSETALLVFETMYKSPFELQSQYRVVIPKSRRIQQAFAFNVSNLSRLSATKSLSRESVKAKCEAIRCQPSEEQAAHQKRPPRAMNMSPSN